MAELPTPTPNCLPKRLNILSRLLLPSVIYTAPKLTSGINMPVPTWDRRTAGLTCVGGSHSSPGRFGSPPSGVGLIHYAALRTRPATCVACFCTTPVELGRPNPIREAAHEGVAEGPAS